MSSIKAQVALAVCAWMGCLMTHAADVVVREYATSDSVAPGETTFRDIEAFPPPPYVATSPFGIALAPKLEAPDESWDVAVLRLNLLVGSHRAVYLLDVSLLGGFADYEMEGIGIAGLFNSVGESGGAFHVAGIFNFVAFDYNGWQTALCYNCTEGRHQGLQIAVGNYAGNLTGVQIGVANYAERLSGVQIGLINANHSSLAPLLPILNMAF